jgi:hypothetical protein
MTCFEKYKLEHDGEEPNVNAWCPNGTGGIDIDDPKYCAFGKDNECAMCWNREIPENKTLVEALVRAGASAEDNGNAIQKFTEATLAASPVIKDSGERRQFDTGAVRDIQEGKGRMDLLPWAAVMEVSKHCEAGAVKYGEHNVDKGIPTHSLCDSAARHLAKYLDGWDDEPHLLAAAWNLLWAVQMELKHPELVDTPWKHKTEKEN